MKINVEIKGVYDGICYIYDTETKQFEWLDIAIKRTNEKERNQHEESFLKQYYGS